MSAHPAGADQPSWGLGDVAAGMVASLALSTLVGVIIVSAAGWTDTAEIPIWGLALLQIPLWGGYLGAVVLAGRTKGNGVVADFGVSSRALDAPIGLAIGVATQLVAVPLLYLPILWATGTEADELSEPARELAGRAGTTAGWVLFALIVGLGAPVVEELFYRGLFMKALEKRGVPPWAVVLVSSVAFAAIHFQVLQFPGLLLFGLVAGVLTVRSGRLGPALWAHVGFNLATVVLLYVDR